MSGGSWEYAFRRLDELSDSLEGSRDPLRRAFGKHLRVCSKAMHDIEWVDSGDCSPPIDTDAIKKALGKDAHLLELEEVLRDAKRIYAELGTTIQKIESIKP